MYEPLHESERFSVQNILTHRGLFSGKMLVCIWNFSGNTAKVLGKKALEAPKVGSFIFFPF